MHSLSALVSFGALLGWIPMVLAFFAILPARRAVVVSSIAAWLLLPPVSLDLPGIPVYNKAAAATLGIWLATLIFQPHRLVEFRIRWFDLPMLVWCVCPFVSSVLNGLGPYDGMSTAFRQMMSWLLPYLVGRLYLTDVEGLRELALGMIVGGLCLIPFCFLEMKMSPIMCNMVYGFGALGGFEGTRYGFYRPRIFFGTGLELGLWMNTATLVAWWLWRTGQLKTVWIIRGGTACAALLVTTIACRSTGATVLLLASATALWICHRAGTKWAMWALLLAAPLYCFVRINDLWSGDNAVQLIRMINEERADSFEFRLVNEDLLIAKALQQPIFGWGGWGRNFVYDEWENKLSIVDGMWVIAFGSFGLVGLVALTIALLLPAALFLKRFSVRLWDQPGLAPAAAIAVVVDLCLLDGLFNGLLNVIYIIAAGGLVNIVSSKVAQAVQSTGSAPMSAEQQAAQYRDLGRALKDEGRYVEAKTTWSRALELLTRAAAAHPGVPALRSQWCDCANDLAWLLANAPAPALRDPATAVSLAVQTVNAYPECGTYWNTLGVAYYRVAELDAAIKALGRAATLSQGGTAFEHFFLAMAEARSGNKQQAEQWFRAAVRWMEQHRPDHPELIRLRDEAQSIGLATADRSLAVH